MNRNVISQPAYFFKHYRRMWLTLVVLSYFLVPLATLGFFGVIPWLSSVTSVFIFFATFGLHVTMFVAGRWNPEDGFSGITPKEKK